MDTEDMVDIMVATTAEDMVPHMVDTAMDIMAEKSDPLRLKLNQKLMLVPMLGMDMEATDTDIHTIRIRTLLWIPWLRLPIWTLRILRLSAMQ